jgi:hypothetical protein
VNISHEGLSLWYGTPDAPAPGDEGVVSRRGASLVVGVHPAHPANTLTVRYRVDGGLERSVVGRHLRTDHDKQVQYFGVSFPEFFGGKVVEYLPVLVSAGRQAPPDMFGARYPSKFHLAPSVERVAKARPLPAAAAAGAAEYRYQAELAYVASVAVDFGEPQYVGDSAAGMRVNFVVRGGSVEGEGFKASVLESSADHMLVRPDGMGEVRILAVFATADGARLDVEAGGYVDFGPEGYRRALAHDLPDRSPIVVTPLITTRHPRYRWLSRVQCVGMGYTNLAQNKASYQIYAASSRAST